MVQVSVGCAAKIIGMSTSKLKNMTRDGFISCERTSTGHRRYLLKDVERFAYDWKEMKIAALEAKIKTLRETPV